MSDEEKKALERIDYIQDFIIENGQYNADVNDMEYFSKILNLIEKQSKEIEELKQIKSKLDEKNIPIETLLAEFERLEDLEDDLTTVYLNGVYDGEKKVEDKIKAKIEELEIEQESNREDLRIAIDNLSFQNIDKIGNKISINMSVRGILQSLLDKE